MLNSWNSYLDDSGGDVLYDYYFAIIFYHIFFTYICISLIYMHKYITFVCMCMCMCILQQYGFL